MRKLWHGVGEDEEEVKVGLDLDPEEDHSATYRLARDLAGSSASAEDGGAVTHTCARDKH